jgi:hypothetical protein
MKRLITSAVIIFTVGFSVGACQAVEGITRDKRCYLNTCHPEICYNEPQQPVPESVCKVTYGR